MNFHRRLSNSKSPFVFWTLLSIMTDFNYAVLWIVSIQPFGTVQNVPIIIGIIVALMSYTFVLYIVIKDLFFVTYDDILEKQVISFPWKISCHPGYVIFFIFLNEEPKRPVCPLFLPFSSGDRLWIGMFWSQMLIVEYFWVDYVPSILLKHLDRGLMSVLVCVHRSMTYCHDESLKTSSRTWWSVMTHWP